LLQAEEAGAAQAEAEPQQTRAAPAALPAPMEAQARRIFERLDCDGSGRVSVTEFAALLIKDQCVAAFLGLGGRGRARNADVRFQEMCGEGEQELTWPAFLRFLALRGASMAEQGEHEEQEDEEPASAAMQLLPEEESEKACRIFESIDADSSGSITCGELAVAYVRNPGVAEFMAGASCHGSRRRRSADKLFDEMDANGDRKISLDEFLTFVARWRGA